MPIDASIPLQVRPIQIEAPDPLKTLMTVAQLKSLQTDQAMKELQMADLSSKLQTYQQLSQPGSPLNQLLQGQSGGAVQQPMQPAPLRRPLPGGGVGGGELGLGSAAPMGPTGDLQGPTPSGAPMGGPPTPYVPQSSPASVPTAGFAPYQEQGQARGVTPEERAAIQSGGQDQQGPTAPTAPAAPGASPLAGRGPQAAPFQGTTAGPQQPAPSAQDPSQPGVGPDALTRPQAQQADPQQQVDQRINAYRQLMTQYRPDVTAPIVTNLMALDKHGLELKEGALNFASKSQGMVNQVMSAVLESSDPAQAYAQMRQMLIDQGLPQARQLPEQFDRQTVQTLATQALTAKERVDADLERLKQANQTFDNLTKRLEAETKARETVTVQTPTGQELRYKAGGGLATTTGMNPEMARIQQQAGEVEYKQTATGEFVPVPKYVGPPGAGGAGAPGGGAGIAPGQPVVNPATGKPYTSMEALQRQREWQQSIGQQYTTQAQPMQEASLSMGVIRNSLTPPKGQENANDTGLLMNFIRLLNPSTGRDIQSGKTTDFSTLGGVGTRIQRMWERVTNNGVLSPEDRKFVGDYAEKVYGQYSQDYEKNLLNPTRERAKQFPGVVPERDVPDVRTGATPRRLATEAQVQATLADAKARGIPKTREQVLDALRQQGYEVVGGKR